MFRAASGESFGWSPYSAGGVFVHGESIYHQQLRVPGHYRIIDRTSIVACVDEEERDSVESLFLIFISL